MTPDKAFKKCANAWSKKYLITYKPCPYCEASSHIRIDGFYVSVNCQDCGKHKIYFYDEIPKSIINESIIEWENDMKKAFIKFSLGNM